MGKAKAIILIVVVLIGAVAVYSMGGMITPLSFEPTTPIHGYNGLDARWDSVTHHDESYPAAIAGPAIVIDPAYGEINPDNPGGFVDPTGIIGEISQPQVVPDEIEELPTEYLNTTRDDGYVDMKAWKAYEVPLTFTVEIRTGGTGVQQITELKLRLALTENSFAVFGGADISAAYVMWVRTTLVDRVADGKRCEMIPLTTGFSFMLHDARTDEELGREAPIPISQTIDVAKLEQFKHVAIEFDLLKMQPDYNIWTGERFDAQVWLEMEVRVLLLGYWERVMPPHKTGPSPPDPIPQDQTWLIVVVILAIIGVAGTVLIVIRLGGKFHPVLLFIFVAVCWVPLILWIGLDVFGKIQELLGW